MRPSLKKCLIIIIGVVVIAAMFVGVAFAEKQKVQSSSYVETEEKTEVTTNTTAAVRDTYSESDQLKTNSEEEVTKTWTITYKLSGGKNNSKNPKKYTSDTKKIKLKNPSKKGYVFEGWYRDKSFKKEIKTITKAETGNLTLYAKWKRKGTLISDMAKKLAWPESKIDNSYYEPTSEFVEAAKSVGIGGYSDDCLDFVKTCVLASGADESYPIYEYEPDLDQYMQNSEKWERIYPSDSSDLKAGDILVSADYVNDYNHILIYIGNGKIASANLYNWYGRIEKLSTAWWGSGTPFMCYDVTYHVYRLVS